MQQNIFRLNAKLFPFKERKKLHKSVEFFFVMVIIVCYLLYSFPLYFLYSQRQQRNSKKKIQLQGGLLYL